MLIKGSKKNLEKKGNVLIIQLGDIGDVVLTTPAIRAVAENFAEAKVYACVWDKAAGLLEGNEFLEGVIPVSKPKGGLREQIKHQIDYIKKLRSLDIKVAVDLRTGTRGTFASVLSGAKIRLGRWAGDNRPWRNPLYTHLVYLDKEEIPQYAAEHHLNVLKPFDFNVSDRYPFLTVTRAMSDKAAQLLSETGCSSDEMPVALHPFSLWSYKEWGLEKSAALIDYIWDNFNQKTVITGGPADMDKALQIEALCKQKPINLAGKTGIGDLAGIYSKCGFFIGVDSAALHIAAAVNTPTVGLYGPSSSTTWAPRGKMHVVAKKNWDCVPCRNKGCDDSEKSRCIDEFTLEEMIDFAALRLERIYR